ncbi:MAG: hypothetical protein J07HX5_00684 [halophilic archaeon J07HX5]|nr:MAG: hypothetical protein J07HX5_00684 [halophilic archaeon J07HX5]
MFTHPERLVCLHPTRRTVSRCGFRIDLQKTRGFRLRLYSTKSIKMFAAAAAAAVL